MLLGMSKKMNGTHQLLAYADDVNLLAVNIYTIIKNMANLIGVCKEVNAGVK
jgi:hypothetical protein